MKSARLSSSNRARNHRFFIRVNAGQGDAIACAEITGAFAGVSSVPRKPSPYQSPSSKRTQIP